MTILQRNVRAVLAFILALWQIFAPSVLPASAETYPARVVTIIDPYPAGGLGDLLPRAMAQVLQEQTGQTFIIDNKPGATQSIGTRIAAHAVADGYTLLFGSVTSLALNPILKKGLPYDPLKDFEPIALTFVSPMYLVTRPDLKVNSVQELITLREPGKLTYSSGGVGSSSHLAAALFNAMAGTSMTHVPYSGTGPAIRDTMA
jgi:tripartite-type tricarboxylate transporter receptor subunit TctC